MSQRRVLFLCTGNSCRSQMAEAIVNARLGEQWQAFSAGSRPTGSVHPLVLQVLSELGIEHHGRSKSMDEFIGQSFDIVITLCDEMEDECPVWLGQGRVVHQPYPDPARAVGTPEEQLDAFRSVRDAILSQLPILLANP